MALSQLKLQGQVSDTRSGPNSTILLHGLFCRNVCCRKGNFLDVSLFILLLAGMFVRVPSYMDSENTVQAATPGQAPAFSGTDCNDRQK